MDLLPEGSFPALLDLRLPPSLEGPHRQFEFSQMGRRRGPIPRCSPRCWHPSCGTHRCQCEPCEAESLPPSVHPPYPDRSPRKLPSRRYQPRLWKAAPHSSRRPPPQVAGRPSSAVQLQGSPRFRAAPPAVARWPAPQPRRPRRQRLRQHRHRQRQWRQRPQRRPRRRRPHRPRRRQHQRRQQLPRRQHRQHRCPPRARAGRPRQCRRYRRRRHRPSRGGTSPTCPARAPSYQGGAQPAR
mmetsp:Transcript_59684/g.194757  ORF Transcript_59684/g.194757 Transcript_59684/m.194757 type:complete len:240 (+) Transcript_59684:1966-2685(+)